MGSSLFGTALRSRCTICRLGPLGGCRLPGAARRRRRCRQRGLDTNRLCVRGDGCWRNRLCRSRLGRLRLGRRQPRLVGFGLCILACPNARCPIGGTALALVDVEQRALMVELLQRHAALGTDLGQAGGHSKAIGACPLAGLGPRIDLLALECDALALRRLIVGGLRGRSHGHQRHQQQLR
jgi:hypothetical protein